VDGDAVKRTLLFGLAGFAALATLAWGVNVGLQYLGRTASPDAPVAPAPPPTPTAHITATLFYGARDGLLLQPVRVEVPLAEGAVAQGRQIVRALLQPPPAPYLAVIPAGTTLKAFYLTSAGDAFVDLSTDVSTKHPGGTHAELLTVYAIVNTVTTNLQGVQRVQLLVDGKEADSVAGHVDIRRPLERDTALVRQEPPPAVQ
jgi:spore germination protein GerM